jgi:hypothetical protein
MTTSSLIGPWTAVANPPQDLAEIKQQLTKGEETHDGTFAGTRTPLNCCKANSRSSRIREGIAAFGSV